ncbi:FG-GAP-like repeat-containing protein [Seohaeicola saemankumensis]|nr:FG-GAP-like repeat-containing protein [Seohaeicola saemankumensis]MCA0873478.1 FG-GAP-like repeat-containing protein [Seohaeicola saemankumensis]
MFRQSFIQPHFEKRFLLALLIVAGLAYVFWTSSRYPALDEKAMMSGAIQLEDSLSFEAKIALTADMSLAERVFYSTLNWVNTNKKGMTFGVLFAAAFLTAVPFLRRRSFSGRFANSALGLVLGAPLGVCVNCAAPIARGMFSGGLRAETTLSAMMASPTLNVVVLTMLFSLLPVYMAVTKVALSLLLILVLVPLICRTLPREALVAAPEQQAQTPWSAAELQGDQGGESIGAAMLATGRLFLANLWYIVRMTVPLMLLAGFLGSLVATLLPGDAVLGLTFGLLALLVVAAVGVFLPVPIAFDVVAAGALMTAGLEPGFVMALVFTLGSFSVYSFFIVAQTIALRAALLLALAVAGLGVIAGLGAQRYHHWQSDRALELLLSVEQVLFRPAHATTIEDPVIRSDDADRITLTAQPHAPPSGEGDTPFRRREARALGIDKPLEFTMRDMWPPFWEGRSLSSGDIDRDGDLDLVVASTERGLYVYRNDGRGRFAADPPVSEPLTGLPVFNAALNDLNRDGWPDLFLASYLQGNYVLWNREGVLDPTPQPVPNRDNAVLSLALAFDDVNGDGFLDAALGNWAAGWYRRVPGEESRNRLLLSQGAPLDGSVFADLPGIPGETLSVLFSDLDLDGAADLVIGNDFEIPDYFYVGDGQGNLRAITHGDGLIPHTTTTTMAVKSADLFNDGVPEVYLAQIAGRSSGVSETLKMQPLERYCDTIADAGDKAACETNMAIKRWYKAGNNFDPTYAGRCADLSGRYGAECKAMLVKDLAIQRRDPALCKLIAADQVIPRAYCDIHFAPPRAITGAESQAAIPQILRSNVLLERDDPAAPFTDTAGPRGLEIGGWSWDTKIADFDNDGWLDVYVVNGTWVPNEVSPSNLFFHNDGQGGFVEMSGPFGLEDYLMTAAATAFDIDNDGDLDLVTHTVNGPLAAFVNTAANGTTAKSITVSLEDMAGNRDGIGARLTITYAGGRTQTREVQSGGGFMSFDAPRVHFGLGQADSIDSLEIAWRTGPPTRIDGPIAAGIHYHVRREAE